MSDDLSLVLERVRQNRNTAAASTRLSNGLGATQPTIAGSTFRAGDRVFDLESGSIGQVVDQSPATPFTAAGIFVRLDDGRVVTRPIESLVLRPTPPSAL